MSLEPVRIPWLVRYVAMPLGGLAIVCFFVMKGVYAYDGVILMKRGLSVAGIVTISGMPREDSYYTFEVNGESYKGRGPEQLSAGDSLQITYDPMKPRRNRPAGGLVSDVVIFGGILAAGAFGAIWVSIQDRRRHPIDLNDSETD